MSVFQMRRLHLCNDCIEAGSTYNYPTLFYFQGQRMGNHVNYGLLEGGCKEELAPYYF